MAEGKKMALFPKTPVVLIIYKRGVIFGASPEVYVVLTSRQEDKGCRQWPKKGIDINKSLEMRVSYSIYNGNYVHVWKIEVRIEGEQRWHCVFNEDENKVGECATHNGRIINYYLCDDECIRPAIQKWEDAQV